MRVIAAVQKASEVRRILEHLGLPHEVPTLMPARGPPELELWPAA